MSDEYFVHGDTASVGLYYPRLEGRPKFLRVDLVDVRASDGLRLHYDFERDGWAIEQQELLGRSPDGEVDLKWKEVAFVQSWALWDDDDDEPNPHELSSDG
jgi:hypothetical protein